MNLSEEAWNNLSQSVHPVDLQQFLTDILAREINAEIDSRFGLYQHDLPEINLVIESETVVIVGNFRKWNVRCNEKVNWQEEGF